MILNHTMLVKSIKTVQKRRRCEFDKNNLWIVAHIVCKFYDEYIQKYDECKSHKKVKWIIFQAEIRCSKHHRQFPMRRIQFQIRYSTWDRHYQELTVQNLIVSTKNFRVSRFEVAFRREQILKHLHSPTSDHDDLSNKSSDTFHVIRVQEKLIQLKSSILKLYKQNHFVQTFRHGKKTTQSLHGVPILITTEARHVF